MKTSTELLLDLLNLTCLNIDDVVRTSDGFYIGQVKGDIGFNAFIGAPAPVHSGPGKDRTLAVWSGFTSAEKQAVVRRAGNPQDGAPIPLEDFGLTVSNVLKERGK